MTASLLDALAKPPPAPSELDELMSRDPLELAKDPTAIDKIIGYQRNARAAREAKPAGRGKRTDLVDHDNAKPIDLAALGLAPMPAAKPTVKPATGTSSFRRM